MAATVGNEFLLKTVVSGDLAANEFFYHRKCYKDLVRQYNKLISERKFDTNDNDWIKYITLTKFYKKCDMKTLKCPEKFFK